MSLVRYADAELPTAHGPFRLVVYRDPIVRTTIFIDRLAAPFQTVVNSVLTYSFAARVLRATRNTGQPI